MQEEWKEIFEWLDTQPVASKGVLYVNAARRFLPCFHLLRVVDPIFQNLGQSPSPSPNLSQKMLVDTEEGEEPMTEKEMHTRLN